MINRTYNDERKIVQLYYLVPGCDVCLKLYLFFRYVSMVPVSKH